ncbi:hypothetical protein HanIR_Chr17g0894271 [Helianthus annuus]|nr:hypothetical protein HanIR_Chr17g0894271 [Helianthus annuus]
MHLQPCVIDDPDTYVTEAAHRIISKNLFSTPQFKSLCSTSSAGVGLSVSIWHLQNQHKMDQLTVDSCFIMLRKYGLTFEVKGVTFQVKD